MGSDAVSAFLESRAAAVLSLLFALCGIVSMVLGAQPWVYVMFLGLSLFTGVTSVRNKEPLTRLFAIPSLMLSGLTALFMLLASLLVYSAQSA